jgi:hypothetical protein
MGMAASQARFLNLTARKNNVEFEGQQINQQRTTLSNQSANYYNDLLGMSVPTPPSVDEFTKITYSFSDGALTNTLTSMIPVNTNGEHTYTISYNKSYTDDFAIVAAASSVVSDKGEQNHILRARYDLIVNGATITYSDAQGNDVPMNSQPLSGMNPALSAEMKAALNVNDSDDVLYCEIDGKTYYVKKPLLNGTYKNTNFYTEEEDVQSYAIGVNNLKKLGEDDICERYSASITGKEADDLIEQEKAYLNQLRATYGENTEWFVRYVQNASNNSWNPVFYNAEDLDPTHTTYDTATGYSQSTINCYTIGSKVKTEEIKNVKGCVLEKDSTGRFISVSIPRYDSAGNRVGEDTYELSTHTITDQDKYDDAMNDYEFKKAQYDKSIQNINAKIEIIQQQDKNLELRLKQLDTEENALNTELEAVKKVIQTNVGSSFKTFNG